MLIFQLISFSRIWSNYPAGLKIAGIPVGLLDRQQAAERLLEVYSQPIELHYNEAIIQLPPSTISFELDLESMLAAAEIERTRIPFWQGFWDYLWGRTGTPSDVPLRSSFSEERLRVYLQEDVALRYNQLPKPALPIPGGVTFEQGAPGTVLDIDRSVSFIREALVSNRQRLVSLPLQRIAAANPTFQHLEILLKQIVIDIQGYEGALGLYMVDLQTGQEISFYYDNKALLSNPPDIPFTASSTIKIPIMVSAFRRLGETSPSRNLPILQEIENGMLAVFVMERGG